ncbi:MAG TPA: M23 family metallopeptidase [Thermoanaerobaculia bacterium]
MLWFFILFTVLLPGIGILWMFRRSPQPRLGWIATFAFAAALVGVSVVAAPWGWLGYGIRVLMLAFFIGSVISSWRRKDAEPQKDNPFFIVGRFALAVFFFNGLGHALAGWREPSGAIDMQFPLAEGVAIVGQGGSTMTLNYHNVDVSQRYALDVQRLNPLGMRAWGLLPEEPKRYAIFGTPVVSPCDGTVLAAVDGLADNRVGQTDPKNLAGNHVVLRCGAATVYLAHFQKGSVAVKAGAPVKRGTPLARVGNSGNTTEPHLHIHAERGGTKLGSAPGVPLTFGGRWLVRNSLVF